VADYHGEHEKLRARYQKAMDDGKVFQCWRCTGDVDPAYWDLGHDDNDHSKWMGPEHVSCNRAVNRNKSMNVVDDSRDW
jgi:hypothetical protein